MRGNVRSKADARTSTCRLPTILLIHHHSNERGLRALIIFVIVVLVPYVHIARLIILRVIYYDLQNYRPLLASALCGVREKYCRKKRLLLVERVLVRVGHRRPTSAFDENVHRSNTVLSNWYRLRKTILA